MHLVGDVLVLNGLVQGGQAPESLLVFMGRVLGLQVGPGTVQGFAVLRNRIRKVPHHGARLGVAERVAAMHLHHHALNATGQIGLPVLAFGRCFLRVGEVIPPAQLLEQHMVKLGVARSDVGTERVRAILGQQIHTFALDAKIGAEVAAAVHHMLRRVIEIGRTRVLERGRAKTGPGQAKIVAGEVVAGFLVFAARGSECLDVKQMHVAHVRLEPLRRLAGVADGPHRRIDFAQYVLGHGFVQALDFLHLEVFGQFLAKAQLVGKLLHDHVIAAALPKRLDHFLAPLNRAVGGCDRAAGFKLSGRRQQVNRAIGVEIARLARHRRHRCRGRRIGVNHHEQIELVHRALHLQPPRLGVGRMAPVENAAQVRVLIDQLIFFQHAVNPARHGNAGLAHHGWRGELAFDPFVIDTPDLGKMLPGAFDNAVITGQRIGVGADVGRALHVVVAAENIGAAAGLADIAKRELQNARGPHHRVADGVLGLAHAPDQRTGPVLAHHRGHAQHLFFLDAAGLLDLVRRPFGEHLFLDLLHAIDPVVEVLLVFPAVLEDVIKHTKQERYVGARADAHVFVGLGRCAREARVDHNHLAAVFLGMQHVQHTHRMRFGRIRADVQRTLAVLHVVVGIGHGAITPGVGHTGHRRGVADARLVVAVVGAPETHEFAQQVGLFVVVFA